MNIACSCLNDAQEKAFVRNGGEIGILKRDVR